MKSCQINARNSRSACLCQPEAVKMKKLSFLAAMLGLIAKTGMNGL